MEQKLIRFQEKTYPFLRKELYRNWVQKYKKENIKVRLYSGTKRIGFLSTEFENNRSRVIEILTNDYYFSIAEELRFQKVVFYSHYSKQRTQAEEVEQYLDIADTAIKINKGV